MPTHTDEMVALATISPPRQRKEIGRSKVFSASQRASWHRGEICFQVVTVVITLIAAGSPALHEPQGGGAGVGEPMNPQFLGV